MRRKTKATVIPRFKWYLLIGGMIFLGILLFYTFRPSLDFFNNNNIRRPTSAEVAPYYPRISFKLPPDIARERVATTSARSFRLPIIMYHYVEYVADAHDLIRIKMNISPAIFEHQLQSVKNNGYQTIFMRDVPQILAGVQPVSPKTIALTFDDGYEDFYSYVFPLLKKYRMKATIYIIYNFINRRGYLNDVEIEELKDSGLVELAAHTLDHVDLPMERKDLAWKEISESKTKLANRFGVDVVSFAYPYGAFSKDVVTMTEKAGFTSAVSVIPGINQSESNLFYLYRLRPGILWGNDPVRTLESYRQK